MKEAVIYQTEAEFRQWFEQNHEKVGVKKIILSQRSCPDYVVKMQDGVVAKIEAELFAIDFKYHRHDPSKVDYILACYSKTDQIEGVPVIAINKLWIYEAEPMSPLPPDEPLSRDEGRLLSAIHLSGGISISAFSSGELSGDQQIFMRVPPKVIGSLPRGKIEDNIFNIISPRAKKYLKKYNHILIGAGLSEKGCELIELLTRRGLIRARPIAFISSAYDGVIIDHDGWVPTELYATPPAWKYQKDTIMKHFHG